MKHYEDKTEVIEPGEFDEEMGAQDEEEAQQKGKKDKKPSKKAARKQAREDRKGATAGKDYELFLRDLEDDPELRANVNLYRDDDIMAELESKMNKMGLDEETTSKL